MTVTHSPLFMAPVGEVQRQLAEALLAHPEIYQARECAQNVRGLLNGSPGRDVQDQLDVIILLPRQARAWEDLSMRRYSIPAPQQSLFSVDSWPHHVILASGGRVYDFDYKGVPGTDIADYVDEMFALERDMIDTIVVPGEKFGESLGDVLLRALYGAAYPRLPLQDYASMQRERYGRQEAYSDLMTRQESYRTYRERRSSNLTQTSL